MFDQILKKLDFSDFILYNTNLQILPKVITILRNGDIYQLCAQHCTVPGALNHVSQFMFTSLWHSLWHSTIQL